MERYVLAGGCFWCLDAVDRSLDGVTEVVFGYPAGSFTSPSYEAVCTSMTGHTEAVQLAFDPDVVPSDVILDVFFTLGDPRQLNRQGNDIASQYRSGMYFADEDQRQRFQAAIDRAADTWDGRVVTELEPLGVFHRAEEYHQDFFAKNSNQGNFPAVALPKVNTVRKSSARYVRAA